MWVLAPVFCFAELYFYLLSNAVAHHKIGACP